MDKLNELKSLLAKKNSNPALMELFKNIQMMKGDQGDIGPEGKTPKKGVDYYTEKEIKSIIDYVQSQVLPGPKGEPGIPGKNGDTPVRGLDYWTLKDQEKILTEILSKIPKPKDGISPNLDEIVRKAKEEIKKEPLHLNDIKGTKELIEFLKLGGFRGGGGSGGGTTSPLTTKGDIYTYSTTNDRLPVGTNGQILSADSSTLTGLKWIVNSGGGMSIGGTVTGGTDGSVLFINPDNILAQDNDNFFYDETSKQLRIGLTGAPWDTDNRVRLGIVGNVNDYSDVAAQNQSAGDSATTDFFTSANNDSSTLIGHYTDFGITSSGWNPSTAGNIKTVSIATAGMGYSIGDVLTISSGDGNATVQVTNVNGGGGVTAILLTNNGTGYTTGTGVATTGGGGSGFTINVLSLIDFTLWGANDGYLYNSGGNLVISTDTSAKVIKFSAGGIGTSNLVATMTGASFGGVAGQLMVGTTTQNSGGKIYAVRNVTGLINGGAGIIRGSDVSTYNTTSGAIATFAGYFNATGTRTSGSNNLINVALYLQAQFGDVNTALMIGNGNIAVDSATATARLHFTIAQGSAGSAPIKFTGGTSVLATPEIGAIEMTSGAYVSGSHLYWTSSAGTRYQLDQQGSGTPAGSDTEIQFNDSGVFGADPNLLFDKSVGLFTTQNIFARGDSYNSGFFSIDVSAGIGYIGDINSDVNGIYFQVNDGAQEIGAYFPTYGATILADSTGVVNLGDWNGNVNGNYIVIDDPGDRITIASGLTNIFNPYFTLGGSDAINDMYYRSSSGIIARIPIGTTGQVLTYNGSTPIWATPTTGTVTSVSGTANRITSTGGATPVIDISASYVGQTSITTLGTITTGTWNATVLAGQYGGTGVANIGKTITLGGNLTTSGAFASTFTMTNTTTVTFPTTGTLATLAGVETFTNKTLVASTNVLGGVTMTLGSDATGDIYYRNSGGILTRLGIGSSTQVLTVSGGLPSWQAATGGSGITIGTTTITSGTNTRILYDNSGVIGEYTLTGTGTVVVMQNTPTLITPVLGIATYTTLIGGNITDSGLTAGRVTFAGTVGILSDDGKFLWDNTNKYLGVGGTPQSIFLFTQQTSIQTPVATSLGQFVGLDANPLRITFDTHNNSTTAGTALMFRRSRGTGASPSAVSSGDVLASLNARGYGTSQYAAASTGVLSWKANEAFTNTANGTYLSIDTTPDGSVTAAEVARFQSDRLRIGVPTVMLGKIDFAGNTSGSITVQSVAVATGVNTLQAVTDTFVYKNTTDTLTNKTLTTPVINGISTGTGVSASDTANTLVLRDGNANILADNWLGNYATTATAAGTTTLTVNSDYLQNFSGSSTQTVVLPDATTLAVGHSFQIDNNSTGTVTLNVNGGTLLQTITAGNACIVICTDVSTSAGVWTVQYSNEAIQWIKQSATYTLTNTTAVQKLFNASTNGALTVKAGYLYEFEGIIALTSMSGTSGNFSFSLLGAGTASLTSASYGANGTDGTTITTGNAGGGSFNNTGVSVGNILLAGTGVTAFAHIKGIVVINAAGTIIPSVALTTAAAAVVGVGTYMKFTPLGLGSGNFTNGWS